MNDPDEERYIRSLTRVNRRPYFNPSNYNGKLYLNELLDWIKEIEKYTVEDKKVRYSCTKLKGHASVWLEHLQVDRQRRGKENSKSWERVVNKLKLKFILVDYQVNLFKKLLNWKQKEYTVKEYTEAFYNLNIKSRHNNDEIE